MLQPVRRRTWAPRGKTPIQYSWDRHDRLLRDKHPGWIDVEWFPAYAPELNPVEQIWNHSKYSDLANFIPQDIEALDKELANSIQNQSHNNLLILSHFKFAKLKL